MSPPPSEPDAIRRPLPPGTFRLVTVAGIDVTVATSWFFIVALIAFLMAPQIQIVSPGIGPWAYVAGAGFAVLLYASVLLHELSHALAARAFDMSVLSINLHFLGGATEIEGEAATPWREFVIAVVGPITSLAIGGAGWLVVDSFDRGLVWLALAALTSANLVVGVLNLVPGLPLDGGRVLQAAVWAVARRRSTGVLVAAWGGRVAALAAVAYPFVMPFFGRSPEIYDVVISLMVAAFLWTGATQALQMAKVRSKLPALQARRLARPAIGVPADLPLAEAIRRAQEAHAGSVVIVASDGRPLGIVNEAAVASTPPERRPWLAVGDVARKLEPGLQLAADLAGESLLRAMQATPASEYVLVEPDSSIYGVLVSKDVDVAFAAA
ncbi:MAG: site-2 protease family protein [Nocardioidaceae bacterium]